MIVYRLFTVTFIAFFAFCCFVFCPQIQGAGLADKYCQKGISLTKKGNHKAAEVEFKKVLSLAPDNLKANYYLYRINRDKGKSFRAFDYMREVLAIEPSFRNIDRAFQEFVPALLPHIKARLKSNRSDAKAQQMLGFILVHVGRFTEGLKKLHFSLKLNPLDALVYDDISWAYYKMRRYEKALSYSSKAFNLAAELPSVSSHYKQLFYIKKFGQKVVRADNPKDFYPPERKSSIKMAHNGNSQNPIHVNDGSQSGNNASAAGNLDNASVAGNTEQPATTPDVHQGTVNKIEDSNVDSSKASDSTNDSSADSFRAGDVQIDFVDVDLDDDKLMSQLMAGSTVDDDLRASNSTSSANDGGEDGNGNVSAGDSKMSDDSTQNTGGPVKVPSPLATLKKLNKAYSDGEQQLRLGEFGKAEQSFYFVKQLQKDFKNVQRLYSKAKKLADARQNLAKGKDLLAASAYSKARSCFSKISKKDLRKISSVKSLDNLIGECLYREKNYSSAVVKLEKWLKLNPEDYRYKYMVGKCYYEKGDSAGAYEHIAVVKSKAPEIMNEFSGSKTLYLKILIKTFVAYIIGAAVLWFVVLFGYIGLKVKGHTDTSAFKEAFALINAHVRDENWDEVLEVCDSLEGRKKGIVEKFRIDYARAQGLLGKSKLDEAFDICTRLLVDYSEDQMTHTLYAKVLLARKIETEEAIGEYRNLLLTEPNNRLCLEMLSKYFKDNQILEEEAEQVMKVLLNIDPDNSEYQLDLARFYLQSSRYGVDEMARFSRYLEIEPANIAVREGLVKGLIDSDDSLAALRECNEIIKAEPLRRSTHELMLISYRHLSMFEEALERYKQFSSSYPDEPYFADQITVLETESIAHRDAVRSEKREGKDFTHYYNRGVKLYGSGKYDEAISPLRAAFRSPKLKIHSGSLLVKSLLNLNQIDGACDVFKELKIIDDNIQDEFVVELCYEMASIFAENEHKATALTYYKYISRIDVNYKDVFTKIEDLQEELKLES